jgi:hypothetical protein
MSGLLEALFSSMPSSKQQKGGAPGSGYGWHRQNAINNLKPDALVRRDAWLKEVRDIYQQGGLTWREALTLASNNRKEKTSAYQSVKDRTIAGYTGRNAQTVKCQASRPGGKAVCPGRYDKVASTDYRPHGHANKRVLTQEAAKKLLKDYYRSRKDLVKAHTAMKRDISTKRNKALKPCPVKQITDSLGRTRSIAVKTAQCADNWLYKPGKYDMSGVDHGDKKSNPQNNTILHKIRSDKGVARGPRATKVQS